MPRYYVVTPEYGTEIPVCDGRGPVEYGCDVIEVEAPTKRQAITEGVKRMLKGPYRGWNGFKWCRDQRGDGCNPFAGVKAHLIVEEPAEVTP